MYELDLERIKGLTKALKKTFPDVYRPLLEARASFLGKPKERSHPSQSDKLGSFDYSKDV